MTTLEQPLGLFGGTFDPVHVGHLRTAFELRAALGLEEVRFIPSRVPPHRPPAIAPEPLRLRMLDAALAGEPGLVIDDRELRRPGPSWTVDTLESFRAEMPERPLCLLLGMDAFLGLATWHRWQEIPGLAHIVVAHRPGYAPVIDGELAGLRARRETSDAAELARSPAGRILFRGTTQLDIASSSIRELVADGGDPRFLVPDPVRELILSTHIYDGAMEVRTRAQ